MSHRVVYASVTGVLEPLGYSQVARILMPLAKTGSTIELVSLERARDLDRRAALEAELAASGIAWFPLPYVAGGAGALHNQRRLTQALLQRSFGRGPTIVHARGYIAASAAALSKAITRAPYIFDTRGYWFDEQRESGRRLKSRAAYAVAKRFERGLFQQCAASVTLTQLATDDIRNGMFGPWPADKPAEVITTVADYEAFTTEATGLPLAIEARLRGRLVLGLVGSVNAWYETLASLQLFKKVRQRRSDAFLLALCRQEDELRALMQQAGVDPADVEIVSVPNKDMPAWLGRMDWGFLLLRPCFAKRASMPTKLGEFFAAGVRPISRGCNSEVDDWVARGGSGVVLPAVDERSLDDAAARIAATVPDSGQLQRTRDLTRAHFGLESSVQRYRGLYETLARD